MNNILKKIDLPGMFISFDGGEATGKSTISNKVAITLTNMGYKVLQTREPGGVLSAESIRDNIFSYNLDDKSELLLFLASRRENIVHSIIPALKEGKIVICDRFYLSSLVYQGIVRGLDIDTVLHLNSYVCEDILPDINIVIQLPYEISLDRKLRTSDINRFDLAGEEFHRKVQIGFDTLQDLNLPNIEVLDGKQDIETLTQQSLALILKKLK